MSFWGQRNKSCDIYNYQSLEWLWKESGTEVPNHYQAHSLSLSPSVCKFESDKTYGLANQK